MTVGGEDIEQAIEVIVEEESSKGQHVQ